MISGPARRTTVETALLRFAAAQGAGTVLSARAFFYVR